jgi:hypothetical protein
MLDTINRAIGMFSPSQLGDAIYLLSDAGDNFSKDTIEKVRTRLLLSGVRLHLIFVREGGMVVPMARYFSEVSEDQPGTFSALALESGGWVIDVPASLDQESVRLRGTITAAIQAMVSDPLIEVQIGLPHELTKWQSWNLHLLDEHGRKRNNLMLLYPHFLAPQECVAAARR